MIGRDLLKGVQSLFFPALCGGCEVPLPERGAFPLCADCLKELPRSQPPWCRQCGRSLANLGAGVDLCLDCRVNRRYAFDQAISACRYESVAKELLLALKYKGRLSEAPFLGQLLAGIVGERLGVEGADAIVPVPLHPTRLRERTFNQAHVLAKYLAQHLDVPCWGHLLQRRRATRPQAELDKTERLANVRGAFGLRPDPAVAGSSILLVDDIFTTGATADACAQLLKKTGAHRVTVVTVAHG